MLALLARLWFTLVNRLAPVTPQACPYCPGVDQPHWSRWGFYWRFAQGHLGLFRVQRYMCRITGRTFSLLPHGLLPFHFYRTASILKWLHGLVGEGRQLRACARKWKVPRATLRRTKAAFLQTVPKLRLPGIEGALDPREFLVRLSERNANGIARLFQDWKEKEPKHCVVGIYRR